MHEYENENLFGRLLMTYCHVSLFLKGSKENETKEFIHGQLADKVGIYLASFPLRGGD